MTVMTKYITKFLRRHEGIGDISNSESYDSSGRRPRISSRTPQSNTNKGDLNQSRCTTNILRLQDNNFLTSSCSRTLPKCIALDTFADPDSMFLSLDWQPPLLTGIAARVPCSFIPRPTRTCTTRLRHVRVWVYAGRCGRLIAVTVEDVASHRTVIRVRSRCEADQHCFPPGAG
jgi:hypothetical protein